MTGTLSRETLGFFTILWRTNLLFPKECLSGLRLLSICLGTNLGIQKELDQYRLVSRSRLYTTLKDLRPMLVDWWRKAAFYQCEDRSLVRLWGTKEWNFIDIHYWISSTVKKPEWLTYGVKLVINRHHWKKKTPDCRLSNILIIDATVAGRESWIRWYGGFNGNP